MTDQTTRPVPVEQGAFVDLRSDTFSLPSPRMLEAMATARLGDDVYGEDPTVRELEARAAELLGKQAAVLMPSGTMANLAAVLAHCPRGTKAIVGDQSDIYVYEAGGASVCGGVVYHPVPNRPDGTLDQDRLDDAFPDDPEDPQFALPAMLSVENPHNRCGGTVLPADYSRRLSDFARARGIPVHLDGARIFNAAVARNVPAGDLAAAADSVQFCLSKGLSAPAGSMLAGDDAFIKRARRVRKMLGGGMRQAGILAAAGLVALEERAERLEGDHVRARRLAAGLSTVPGLKVLESAVDTNMVYFSVRDPDFGNEQLLRRAWDAGVRLAELGKGRIRAVTHSGVREADVDRAVDVVRTVMSGRGHLSGHQR